MKIFINPGHCVGVDPGAQAFGLQEAKINLDVALKLQSLLYNFDTRLYYYDGLEEIVDACNYWDADYFISIHCNAFDGFARGTETYYGGSTESYDLANKIQNNICNKIHTVNRGVKHSNFYVTRWTYCPAVLVELAFIDNDQDANLLINNQDDFAQAIANAF